MPVTGEVFNPSRQRTFLAGGNLTAKQFHGVALGADENEVVAANAQTNVAIGILLNAPAENDTASVALFGPTVFVTLGGTVTKGAKLTFDAAGKLIATTTDNDVVAAIAFEAGTNGQRIEAMLVGGFRY